MTTREYFKQAFTIDNLLKATRMQLVELREKRLSLGGFAYGDKVQNVLQIEKFNAMSDLYMDLEQKYSEDEKRLIELKYEIRTRIDNLPSPQHRLIMTERYINLKHWEDIAADNGYSWKHVHKIHRKALITLTARKEDTL